jgi:hypothetical protein
MWPPIISESHTEQLASYRWPQNKSIAIKEKIPPPKKKWRNNIVLIYICEKTTSQEYTSI